MSKSLVKFTHIEALIVNTICIYDTTGNIHIMGIFFVAFKDADYKRCLWIYKITIEQVQTTGRGVQILVILWQRNNWMNPFGLVWLAEESLHGLISRRS